MPGIGGYLSNLWKHLGLFSSIKSVSWAVGWVVVPLLAGWGLSFSKRVALTPGLILFAALTLGFSGAFIQANYRLWQALERTLGELRESTEFRLDFERELFTVSRDDRCTRLSGALRMTCKSPWSATSVIFREVNIPEYPNLQLQDITIDGKSAFYRYTGDQTAREQHIGAGNTRFLEIGFRFSTEGFDNFVPLDKLESIRAVLMLDGTHWLKPTAHDLLLKRLRVPSPGNA